MNKEEAIKEINKVFEPAFANYIIIALTETVSNRTLEQESCEDAVSRQAVLKEIHNWSKDEFLKTTEPFDFLRKRIDGLPPVTPTRKKEKWQKHKGHHSTYYKCSLCGCFAPCTETADSFIWRLSNYCPDCGAEIKREEEHMYQEVKKKHEK